MTDPTAAVLDVLNMLQRKLDRGDEIKVRIDALCGNKAAQRLVRRWDLEDDRPSFSEYLPDGSEVKTLSEVAAILGTTKQVAAMYVLEHPGLSRELKAEAEANADSPDDSFFLGLLPRNPEHFTVPGGIPADEMHMTLFYTEYAPMEQFDYESVMLAVHGAKLSKLEGELAGYTVFNGDGEAPLRPLVHLVSSPGLEMARNRIKVAMNTIGIRCSKRFGYMPHMTMAYVDSNKPRPQLDIGSLPVVFDRLRIRLGSFGEDIELQTEVMPDSAELETKPTSLIEG